MSVNGKSVTRVESLSGSLRKKYHLKHPIQHQAGRVRSVRKEDALEWTVSLT